MLVIVEGKLWPVGRRQTNLACFDRAVLPDCRKTYSAHSSPDRRPKSRGRRLILVLIKLSHCFGLRFQYVIAISIHLVKLTLVVHINFQAFMIAI